MKEQVLSIHNPIVISTPLGLIRLETLPNDKRKLKITMPPVFEANRGDRKDRVMTRFLTDEGQPKFHVLLPVTDVDGKLVDVTFPGEGEYIYQLVEGRSEGQQPVTVENDDGNE